MGYWKDIDLRMSEADAAGPTSVLYVEPVRLLMSQLDTRVESVPRRELQRALTAKIQAVYDLMDGRHPDGIDGGDRARFLEMLDECEALKARIEMYPQPPGVAEKCRALLEKLAVSPRPRSPASW